MIFEKQIEKVFRAQLYNRCDDTGNVYYFSADDFEGLKKDDYEFASSMGHALKGAFYHYDSPIPERIVVFDHGFGGGHRAYMKEIELLCRHGFLVFAYDHTGCMESGGETPNGFSQSLCDLNDCLAALKADEKYNKHDISVMGHSWGAFSCLNIATLHPDVSHIVAISGFVSVSDMIEQNFSGILKPYRKTIMRIERESNPRFVDYDAVKSLSGTDASVLLIYSSNDKLVSKKQHYDKLKAGLSGKNNVRMLLVENKGHNPNYTDDALRYKDDFFKILTKKVKNKELDTPEQKKSFVASFDWNRMTAQDESVWSEIFKTLDAAQNK